MTASKSSFSGSAACAGRVVPTRAGPTRAGSASRATRARPRAVSRGIERPPAGWGAYDTAPWAQRMPALARGQASGLPCGRAPPLRPQPTNAPGRRPPWWGDGDRPGAAGGRARGAGGARGGGGRRHVGAAFGAQGAWPAREAGRQRGPLQPLLVAQREDDLGGGPAPRRPGEEGRGRAPSGARVLPAAPGAQARRRRRPCGAGDLGRRAEAQGACVDGGGPGGERRRTEALRGARASPDLRFGGRGQGPRGPEAGGFKADNPLLNPVLAKALKDHAADGDPDSRRKRHAVVKSMAPAWTPEALERLRRSALQPTGRHEDVPLSVHADRYPGAVYTLFVPRRTTPSRPWPLLIGLHGGGPDGKASDEVVGSGDSAMNFYDREAAERGVIVACPNALMAGWGNKVNEDLVRDLITEMRLLYHIDIDRIHLTGHSMGGYGTWALGPQMAELFATISPMAGAGGGGVEPLDRDADADLHLPLRRRLHRREPRPPGRAPAARQRPRLHLHRARRPRTRLPRRDPRGALRLPAAPAQLRPGLQGGLAALVVPGQGERRGEDLPRGSHGGPRCRGGPGTVARLAAPGRGACA